MPNSAWRGLKTLLALAALCATVFPGQGSAEDYPLNALRVIIPAEAGGNPDFVARPIMRKMAAALKQPIIVDNRPGPAGIDGVELASRAGPDGYTLLFAAVDQVATTSALYEKLPFDAIKDFLAISRVADAPFALVVHPLLPAKSLRDLIGLAKARPRQMPFASAGIGSFSHFITEALDARVGIDMLHVPYTGSAAAVSALLSGEVAAAFATLQTTLPHMRAKRLRALAIGWAQRVPIAPDIPTFSEAGVAGFTASRWFGLFAPVNTPDEVIMRLNAEVAKALGFAEIRRHLEQSGIEPIGSTPEALAALVRSDIERFRKVAREASIRVE